LFRAGVGIANLPSYVIIIVIPALKLEKLFPFSGKIAIMFSILGYGFASDGVLSFIISIQLPIYPIYALTPYYLN